MTPQELVLQSLSAAGRERVLRFASKIGERLSPESAQWILIGAVAEIAADLAAATEAGVAKAMEPPADRIGNSLYNSLVRYMTKPDGPIARMEDASEAAVRRLELFHRDYLWVAGAVGLFFLLLGIIVGNWWSSNHHALHLIVPQTQRHSRR